MVIIKFGFGKITKDMVRVHNFGLMETTILETFKKTKFMVRVNINGLRETYILGNGMKIKSMVKLQ